MLLDPLSTFARLHAYRLTNASQSQARIQKRGAANTFRHRYVMLIILNFCRMSIRIQAGYLT